MVWNSKTPFSVQLIFERRLKVVLGLVVAWMTAGCHLATPQPEEAGSARRFTQVSLFGTLLCGRYGGVVDLGWVKGRGNLMVHLTGEFRAMRTRSVERQEKDGLGLAEAAKTEAKFEMGDTTGDLVGFRLPGYLNDPEGALLG